MKWGRVVDLLWIGQKISISRSHSMTSCLEITKELEARLNDDLSYDLSMYTTLRPYYTIVSMKILYK